MHNRRRVAWSASRQLRMLSVMIISMDMQEHYNSNVDLLQHAQKQRVAAHPAKQEARCCLLRVTMSLTHAAVI